MKTILIDLDGVLNKYNGDFDGKKLPEIQKGAKDFLQNLAKNYNIKIFTTRNKLLVAKWVIENNQFPYIDDITDKKELCWLFIDDRCIKFDGSYSCLIEKINSFQPWYKQQT